jgi:GxxExxY protein
MPTQSHKGYDFDNDTYPIIGACLKGHKELGPGSREVIYQRALALELQASGLDFAREERRSVHYRGQVIGKHRVDFIIGSVMIEIKASSTLDRKDFVQAVSYLKASGHRSGLLVNFGQEKLDVHRLVWDAQTQQIAYEG